MVRKAVLSQPNVNGAWYRPISQLLKGMVKTETGKFQVILGYTLSGRTI